MNRRIIDLTALRLSEATDEVMRHLRLFGSDRTRLYQQGGTIVRLRNPKDDGGRVEPIGKDALRDQVDRLLDFVAQKQGAPTRIDPPMKIISGILALPEYQLDHLRTVASAPFFTKDGTLVATPGYHPACGVYLALDEALRVPAVPSAPTLDDVERAKALIVEELFGDFPYVAESDRAHAVAALLQPFIRQVVDALVPAVALDAPKEGSGKGLQVHVMASLRLGASRQSCPRHARATK